MWCSKTAIHNVIFRIKDLNKTKRSDRRMIMTARANRKLFRLLTFKIL